MNLKKIPTIVGASLALSLASNAAVVTITALDLRNTGAFGHADASAGATNTGPGDPVNMVITYANLDLDGDATANDTVIFTVTWTSIGTAHRLFNQGADTGFGNLTGLTASVTSVSGTTTDSGATIAFDGFTGGAIGAGVGAGTDLTASATINGTTANISQPDNGNFRFGVAAVDFALAPTVVFDAGTSTGSVVARHYDLQFSTVPEPSVALLGALGMLGLLRRRR